MTLSKAHRHTPTPFHIIIMNQQSRNVCSFSFCLQKKNRLLHRCIPLQCLLFAVAVANLLNIGLSIKKKSKQLATDNDSFILKQHNANETHNGVTNREFSSALAVQNVDKNSLDLPTDSDTPDKINILMAMAIGCTSIGNISIITRSIQVPVTSNVDLFWYFNIYNAQSEKCTNHSIPLPQLPRVRIAQENVGKPFFLVGVSSTTGSASGIQHKV